MKLRLVKKVEEARNTFSYFWEAEKPVSWLPGQYYYFTIPKLNYPDNKGSTRHFTIASSPTEEGLLQLTTRIREESGYKKTLNELQIGSIIDGQGPNGTFVLDENEKSANHILIAGGIGITPFRSIIKYAVDKGMNKKIHLIYSNSVPEEIAFRTELENWAKIWPNLTLSITVSHPEESKEKWTGLTGRIDDKLITKLYPNLYTLSPSFWLCGPPPMIDTMEEVLSKLKIPSGNIHSEKFTGY